jgi:hypothetical protein
MAYPGPVFEKVPEGLNEGLGGLETTGRESLGRAEKIVPRGTMGAGKNNISMSRFFCHYLILNI